MSNIKEQSSAKIIDLEALTQQVASMLGAAVIYKNKHNMEVTPYTAHF